MHKDTQNPRQANPSSSQPVTALYPGSFDPITMGHVDLIHRGARLFDRFIVAIGINSDKKGMFTPEERRQMASQACSSLSNVEVITFEGLTVELAKQRRVDVLVRGLRNETDYQFEFQLAMANRSLASEIDTVFLPTTQAYCHISSRIVKDIARHGGSVDAFVPDFVAQRLHAMHTSP